MVINEITPSSSLKEFIRLYRIVDFNFPAGTVLPCKVYPPRPEHCLQFYPKDTETVSYPNNDLTIANKNCTITGQHTISNHRYVGKEFLAFQVVFQPGALFRITGIASNNITNCYMDAELIFGNISQEINEKLYCAKDYNVMVQIVEQFLSVLIKRSNKLLQPIDKICMQMTHHNEHYSLDRYIKDACLSHRQFDRKFVERVGISPKQYMQIVRFDKAFRLKNRYPEKDWLAIALHCGYYDYQHLAKDFKEFAQCTPNQFLEIQQRAPERLFGEIEV